MGDFIFRKADEKDIDLLTETRIEVLRSANKLDESADMSAVREETLKYYESCFKNNEHTAYLVFDREEFVGCGGVSYYKVMPTFHNVSGISAYIMNIYTRQQYRRKGIAQKTLSLLVEDAKSRGVTRILLEATDMGRLLYEKFGFTAMKNEMELL